MSGMGSPSAGCHPPFPRPSKDQHGLPPAVIAVTSLVTSTGLSGAHTQASLPAAVGEPAANPIAPPRPMHPGGLPLPHQEALCGLRAGWPGLPSPGDKAWVFCPACTKGPQAAQPLVRTG